MSVAHDTVPWLRIAGVDHAVQSQANFWTTTGCGIWTSRNNPHREPKRKCRACVEVLRVATLRRPGDACPWCGAERKGTTTCLSSACQEKAHLAQQARAEGLRANGLPKKGWGWCDIEGCRTPFRHDTLAEPLCAAHRKTRTEAGVAR